MTFNRSINAIFLPFSCWKELYPKHQSLPKPVNPEHSSQSNLLYYNPIHFFLYHINIIILEHKLFMTLKVESQKKTGLVEKPSFRVALKN